MPTSEASPEPVGNRLLGRGRRKGANEATHFSSSGIVLGAAGVISARHDEEHEAVRPLAMREIAERLDGKETKATAVEVTFEPGQAGASHRHPGPAFGYVLEGEYEWAIDDQPAKVLKAGETFYEPGGCLHRVSGNPGKMKTRVLAWEETCRILRIP